MQDALKKLSAYPWLESLMAIKKGVSIFFDPNRETTYAEMDGANYEWALQRNKGQKWSQRGGTSTLHRMALSLDGWTFNTPNNMYIYPNQYIAQRSDSHRLATRRHRGSSPKRYI